MSNLDDLKYEISLAIVKYRSRKLGLKDGEYGLVYDSDKHEQLLNTLVRFIEASYE